MKPLAVFYTLLALAAAALCLPAAPSLADEEAGAVQRPQSQVARILENRVEPAVVELRVGDEIGWLNYSSQRAQVSFDADVAKSLVCKTEGSFRLEGERLTSFDIQARQFASLCTLKPGVYEYQVELRSGVGGGGSVTKRVLVGRIVVTES